MSPVLTRILPTTPGETATEQVVHLLQSDELEGRQTEGSEGPFLLVDLGALLRRIGQRDDGGVVTEAASQVAPTDGADRGGRGLRSKLAVLGVSLGIGWAVRRLRRGRQGRRSSREATGRATDLIADRTGSDGGDARSHSRYTLPILGLTLGIGFALLRRRGSSGEPVEGESPPEATENIAQRTAQTIQRRGEVVAERIESGTESLAEQIETGGETASHRMVETEQRAGEMREEAEETAEDVRDDAEEMADRDNEDEAE